MPSSRWGERERMQTGKKQNRVVLNCAKGTPEVAKLHGSCGTLPSSGMVTGTESVTALQSPLGVIYCATQHLIEFVIFLLKSLFNCQKFGRSSQLVWLLVSTVQRQTDTIFPLFSRLSFSSPSHQYDCKVDFSALLYNLECD